MTIYENKNETGNHEVIGKLETDLSDCWQKSVTKVSNQNYPYWIYKKIIQLSIAKLTIAQSTSICEIDVLFI